MQYTKNEIKKGVTLHYINTNKFKTNLYAVFLAVPLDRKNVTKNALVTAILRRGTNNMKSQDLINMKLEEMYGASFDCGIEKTGDNHVMKFYLEAVNEEFLPEKEELTKKCINLLFDIIFNPLIENNGFKKEYVDGEKEHLKQIIESKIDNKRAYSLERCIEEMFKDKPYGLYRYGYVEDLETLTLQNLYEYYIDLINRCKIDIFVSGEIEKSSIENLVKENEEIKRLKERKADYKIIGVNEKNIEETKTIEEHMQVGQGNLVIGLNVNKKDPNSKFVASVYNAILGGGANSKLFQNVREKESLAYTAGSTYKKQKDAIFIRCGIEIANYEKALNTIKKQLEDMKQGNFTDEDIENSKKLITESIVGISSEQDAEITYCYSQELANEFITLEEYIEGVNKVSKEEIIDLANNTLIDTIYFLRD